MKKRILSTMLCLCTVLGLLAMTASAAGQFTDVKDGDYFAVSVAWAVEQNITNGTSWCGYSVGPQLYQRQLLRQSCIDRHCGKQCPQAGGYDRSGFGS